MIDALMTDSERREMGKTTFLFGDATSDHPRLDLGKADGFVLLVAPATTFPRCREGSPFWTCDAFLCRARCVGS